MNQLSTKKALSFSIVTLFVAAGCLADGATAYAQNRAQNKKDKKTPQLSKIEPQIDPEADKAMELPGIFKVTPEIAQEVTQKGAGRVRIKRNSQPEFSADATKVTGGKARRTVPPAPAEKPASVIAAAPRSSDKTEAKEDARRDEKKGEQKAAKKILIPAQLTNAAKPESSGTRDFHATAYSLKGRTATGEVVRYGFIAADPKVLPLGTLVQIEAGKYSGIYKVADTGGLIKGNKIDIYVPTYREAKLFGRQKIKVKVLGKGGKTH